MDRSVGELGFCQMGAELKIARAALHFWEEPCLSGENGSGAVFFSGCNLRCVYCQNYKISTCTAGKRISIEELSDAFLNLQSQDAHNINLVTPTHFVIQIKKAIEIARKKGLHLPIVYNCGGYESVETIRSLSGYVDIYLPDFKYYDNRYGRLYSAVNDYRERAAEAIAEMVKQVGSAEFGGNGMMKKGVIVRHLMLPGLLFDSKKIIDYLYYAYHDDIWISIMNQYTPLLQVEGIEKLNHPLNPEHYAALLEYAAGIGVVNAFIQEGGTVGESFIPGFFEDE